MKHIYITIPKGWVLAQREVDNALQDVFVKQPPAENGVGLGKREALSENYIQIQSIVKGCLRCKKRNARSETLNDSTTQFLPISIYYRSPPETEDLFIKYEPNNNGKWPALSPEMVRGIDEVKKSFSSNKYTGHLWFKEAPISEERRTHLTEKAGEQRENRRHLGNSPSAT